MGKIKACCISEKKGTKKHTVKSVTLETDWGIKGDAHAGKWHRQISLLSKEKIDEFKAKGAKVVDGDFGENLIIEGIDLKSLAIGTKLRSGEVVIEITQIGKECHSDCEIHKLMGDCIMPREGVFAKVIKGGRLSPGDEIVVDNHISRLYNNSM